MVDRVCSVASTAGKLLNLTVQQSSQSQADKTTFQVTGFSQDTGAAAEVKSIPGSAGRTLRTPGTLCVCDNPPPPPPVACAPLNTQYQNICVQAQYSRASDSPPRRFRTGGLLATVAGNARYNPRDCQPLRILACLQHLPRIVLHEQCARTLSHCGRCRWQLSAALPRCCLRDNPSDSGHNINAATRTRRWSSVACASVGGQSGSCMVPIFVLPVYC